MAELAGCLPRPMRKARANRYQGDAGDSAMDSMTPSNHLDFRKLAAVVWTQLLAEFPKAQLY